MDISKIIKLLISIIICELAGIIGSVISMPGINTWYRNLNKPSFNPPDWIFAPVWTLLFLLTGISFYLVWSKKWKAENKIGKIEDVKWNNFSERLWSGDLEKFNIISIFFVQLLLNVVWSVVFFGINSIATAFSVILMLWVSIAFTIINFYRVSKASAYLLIPYILWVSFAIILNLAILLIN